MYICVFVCVSVCRGGYVQGSCLLFRINKVHWVIIIMHETVINYFNETLSDRMLKSLTHMCNALALPNFHELDLKVECCFLNENGSAVLTIFASLISPIDMILNSTVTITGGPWHTKKYGN